MCGLAGVVHAEPTRDVPAEVVRAMCDAIAHRGPDDAGVHVAGGVGLGSRRLAIVDLSARGHMPMATDDGRYHIVYNGEVYNAGPLREWLRARGHRFHSTTDTEVLLHLYVEQGAAMLERLNGMFAFAVWDAVERTLFAARDRLGVKPFYYTLADGTLRFASEQKALFAGGVRPVFDPATWPELLCFRYVAGEATPFAGVRRLLPGHHLRWRAGRVTIGRWWHLAERAASAAAPDDAVAWCRDTFDSAVDVRRISDVPIGVLLSGGLDSSSVAAALARQAGDGVESFTVRFDEPGYDEGPLARQVVDRWRLRGHELVVPPGELLPRLLHATWLNDEPLAHGNEVHLEAIARHARPHVTVLLSGEGADETLGGYVRYRPLHHPAALAVARAGARLLPDALPLPARARKLARLLCVPAAHAAVLYNACELLPADLAALGGPATLRFPARERVLDEARAWWPGEPLRQAMYLDQHTFLCSLLDRNDRMTMGASIECRVPFLDYRLIEGLAALPTARLVERRRAKALLRDAVGDRLPPALLAARKWGFGVPWGRHLREEAGLRDAVDGLPDSAPVADGPFERAAVRAAVSRFQAGDRRADALVRQLLMVDLWYRACVAAPRAAPRERAPAPAPAT